VSAFLNAVKTGLGEIRVHKLRSALSFMAIAVGSVVFIDSFSAIFSTYDRLQKQKEVSGIARLKITQDYTQTSANPDEYTPPPNIKYEDAVSLRSKLPGLYMVSPEFQNWRNTLEFQGKRVVTTVTGVTPEWAKRDFVYTLKGRFLDWHDVENKLRVCVLVRKAVPPPTNELNKTRMKQWDYTAAFDVLVSHNDMLGKTVQIDNVTFTVVGILEELAPSKRPDMILSQSQDYKVLAPATTLAHYGFFDEESDSMDLSVDAGNENNFEESLKLIENFLKIRFGGDEYFQIDNQMEMINDMIDASVKASLVTISLGMLAFLAGGIGIMNVTLATVFARTKEIGIRRALGARRGDIMLQFIVEAAMLGLIGGVLGSGLGYVWSVPVKEMLGMGASPIKLWMPLVSVLIATLTAFVFAIYPAWVAASLKPADALRTE
jgi:ABC-type antimicrobial peptide transport system permease subunit